MVSLRRLIKRTYIFTNYLVQVTIRPTLSTCSLGPAPHKPMKMCQTFIKSADTKLGAVADTRDVRIKIQKGF